MLPLLVMPGCCSYVAAFYCPPGPPSCRPPAHPTRSPILQRIDSAAAAAAPAGPLCGHDLCLYVRWHSAAGVVKVNRLPLDPIAGVDDLRGLFR